MLVIGGVVFVNTHIKWSEACDPNHSGIAQTKELLEWLSQEERVVILADCNDRPGGPVRALLEEAGYTNVCGNEPTALINQKPAAIDVIATKGVPARRVKTRFRPKGIPTVDCPSDHIPVMACIKMG